MNNDILFQFIGPLFTLILLVKVIIWRPKKWIDPKKLTFRQKNYLTGFWRGLGRITAIVIAVWIAICFLFIQEWVVETFTSYEEDIKLEEILPFEIRKTDPNLEMK